MECIGEKTFKNIPLTYQEKALLLETLRTSPIILDDNQNTVLHMAASITEWPELVNELLSVRPELKGLMNSANKKGITPEDLASNLKTKKSSQAQTAQFLIHPKVVKVSPADVEAIDASVARKLASHQQGISHAPFSPLEKSRLLYSFIGVPFPSTKGNTLLHLAAGIIGYPELTSTLLAVKPHLSKDINKINDEGFSPLGLAYIKDNITAVQALLKAGADPKLA